ncbi:LysR family transcriptional regulator ArgP [Salinibacterium sp.]|uniref:LysR family transcriptional regulator ArgP n=1 Tax=Salinibacterium sp. TaxID=1915057 RepID=UPI00286CEE24|nr:LysR family transcriptional regulator ArgP [Salinibacterium sp.]
MELPTDQLKALTAVVDGGSFEAASRSLSITASAVSQRIKALESEVGRVLVVRSKPVRLTHSGSIVMRMARQVELLGLETAAALQPGSQVVTTIPIVVNADSLATWFLDAVASVDGVTFDITREDQAHSTALLREGTVMAAVTSVSEPVQGCISTRVGGMTYRATASADFVRAWDCDGPARTSLAVAPMIVFDRKDTLQEQYLHSRGVDPRSPPRHYVPGSADFLRAVVLGFGWGMLPDEQAAGLVSSGDLVVLGGSPIEVPLYWQQWSFDSRALADVAVAVASGAPGRAEGSTL